MTLRSNSIIASVILAAAACSTPPTTPRVAVESDTLKTLDDIVVRVVEPSITARVDDEIAYVYEWYVDGALISDLDDNVVPAARTSKGQTWEVFVTATDGRGFSNRTSAKTEIINSLPEVNIGVSNNTPISTDNVSSWVDFYDADGDPIALEWTWFRNGRVIADMKGPDLPADRIVRDEIWRVQVVAHDGTEYGYPDRSDIVVLNGRPQVHSIEIGPEGPDTLQPLVASYTSSDPDNDPLGHRFVWYVNGEPRGGLTAAVVPPDRTTRGQTWQAEIYAFDDELESEPALSNIIEIQNSVPTAPVVAIEDGPEVSSFADMYCRVVSPSVDADRDPLVYTFVWYYNGVEWTGETKRTAHDGDTIPWEITDEGDTWSCAAWATDGIATSPVAVSDEVSIIAILEYRVGRDNLINMPWDCSGGSGNMYGSGSPGGVWWTDTGSVRPSRVTIQYQMGVNCGGASMRSAFINGTSVGTTRAGSTTQCTCSPIKYVEEFSTESLSSYRPGERNEFTMQWLSSDGWSSNPDWRDGDMDVWAIITVSY